MFKITLKSTWNKNGIPTNWIKYLNVNTENEVFDFYEQNKVLKIEECN